MAKRKTTTNDARQDNGAKKPRAKKAAKQTCGNCKHWVNEMGGWADCEVHDLNQPASQSCSDWLSLTAPDSPEAPSDPKNIQGAISTTKTTNSKEPTNQAGREGDSSEDQLATPGSRTQQSTPQPTPPTRQAVTNDPKQDEGAKAPREKRTGSVDTNHRTRAILDKASETPPAATSQATPQLEPTTREIKAGDDTLSVAESATSYVDSSLTREESQAEATRRWRNSGIAEQVAVFRDRVREEYKAQNPGCKRRDAHEFAWSSAIAAFPPPGVDPAEPEPIAAAAPEPETSTIVDISPAPIASDQGVPGLGTLPDSWGTLAANASLQVEISWVSANRLRVRDGNGVDLSKALSPAPSYSALSWLETSILFPSKFADISVKATQNQEDEKEHIRREKLSIEEVRGLLKEMLEG